MRKPKTAEPAAQSSPLQTPVINADEAGGLSNAQLERAASILDEIERLGKELWTVMDGDNGNFSVSTAVGRVLLFVEEGLGIHSETHITPGELAARLRALVPPARK